MTQDIDKIFNEMIDFQEKFCAESEYNQHLFAYIGCAGNTALIAKLLTNENLSFPDDVKEKLLDEENSSIHGAICAYLAIKKLKGDGKSN